MSASPRAADLDGRAPPRGPAFFEALDAHLCVRLPHALASDECERLASSVLAAEEHWTSDFGGEQFALGRAWYTHLETGRSAEYFREAKASDALVERFAPGLQARMIALVEALVGEPTARRPGWCGPGIHVFPDREHVSHEGGVVHFDTEGLTERALSLGLRALSLVWMLRPAREGGGLRLWDVRYRGHDAPSRAELGRQSVVVPYEVGDLLVFDSYRLHQIQPFRGGPRISATAHACRTEGGSWEVWF